MPSAVGVSLLYTFIIDFGIQFACYIPSAILKSEKIYDLSGAITYFTCIIVALLWRQNNIPIQLLCSRQIIAASFVLVWCIRLGYTLFLRVLRSGHDARFDKLKSNPILFLVPWFLQAVWIFLTALPVYIILGNESQPRDLIYSDIIGIIIWVFGFTLESVADFQKNKFKNANPKDFVSTGVWKYSRYANYNGEITLWIGMFILCTHGFVEDWQWVGILSPLFVSFLILCVSGVRLLEQSSDKKYGARVDYQQYKKATSKFFLWPQKKLETMSDTAIAVVGPIERKTEIQTHKKNE